MKNDDKPIFIQKDKLEPDEKSLRISKAEVVESAKVAEKNVLKKDKKIQSTKFIEME